MDNDTITTASPATITPADADSPGDPRELFARAVAVATPVVDAVTPDQFHLPTPCGAFDVEQLLGHLLFALDRVAALGRGDALGTEAVAVTSDDWSADFRVRVDAVSTAWADDGRLGASVELPWATMTGAEALGVYISEVTVHTWDLAIATGRTPDWDDAVCAAALGAMRRELPIPDRDPIWAELLAGVPEGVVVEPPFANAVAVADDATPIDQLVAWTGRSS